MLIDVALPLPLFRNFTYDSDVPVAPGARVVVPLRGSRVIGISLGSHEGPSAVAAPRKILDVPDAEPALAPHMLALCRWIAEYYVVPLGLVVRSALPAALLGADTPRPAPKIQRLARLARDIPSLMERDALFARAKRQREVYELIETLGGRTPVAHLIKQLGVSPGVVHALETRGLIQIDEDVVERDPFAARPSDPARHTPTPAQTAAIDALSAGQPGEVFLLHGITGSGKTLVYVEFLRRLIDERGQTAIVLVPEIALTPQTVDRFRAAFGDRVAVLHSALSDGERSDAWHALKSGRKRIAVGARSAVFAPSRTRGRHHRRRGARRDIQAGRIPALSCARGRDRPRTPAGCGHRSRKRATPSLESWSNASSGKASLALAPGPRRRRPSSQCRRARPTPATRTPPAPASPMLPPTLEAALAETLCTR